MNTTIFAIVVFVNAHAQWNATGDSFTTGKVGIGTTSLQIANTGINTLVIGNGVDSYGIVINSGPNHDGILTFAKTATFQARLRYNTASGALFFEKGNDKLITILGNGNTGFGLANPAERLAVNGNIRAKEVKVETANWPDYVFEDNYSLPDLGETADYIKTNKHLPGMPSAAEVEENGISLGEMNRKLLEKVEELTLHLIRKDSVIKELINRVNTLEERNN